MRDRESRLTQMTVRSRIWCYAGKEPRQDGNTTQYRVELVSSTALQLLEPCNQWRTEGVGVAGFKPPSPKFRRPSKIVTNSTRLWKLLKIVEFRKPTPQEVWKKDSKIVKLPPVRSCFTLAMTNKLVVIINSLKVPKIKKILLYEMKFLVRNCSCLQNPWLGGYRLQIPVLCPHPNLLNYPTRTKFLGTPLLTENQPANLLRSMLI